jgi:hypothetical protein
MQRTNEYAFPAQGLGVTNNHTLDTICPMGINDHKVWGSILGGSALLGEDGTETKRQVGNHGRNEPRPVEREIRRRCEGNTGLCICDTHSSGGVHFSAHLAFAPLLSLAEGGA